MKKMNSIFIIPARKGSKGIPNKNTRIFFDKPLISYSIDYALSVCKQKDIVCVTSNDKRVQEITEKYDDVEFLKRPESLANDNSSMESVLHHVIKCYEEKEILFNSIILLQPTSPLRKVSDFSKIKNKFKNTIDMVVSVKKAKENPYYLLYEEDKNGFLNKSKNSRITRRQDAPTVYCLNGSFFMINTTSLKNKSMADFSKILKVEMPSNRSIDLDNELDWSFLNFLVKTKNIKLK